jgi:hypothetical protein
MTSITPTFNTQLDFTNIQLSPTSYSQAPLSNPNLGGFVFFKSASACDLPPVCVEGIQPTTLFSCCISESRPRRCAVEAQKRGTHPFRGRINNNGHSSTLQPRLSPLCLSDFPASRRRTTDSAESQRYVDYPFHLMYSRVFLSVRSHLPPPCRRAPIPCCCGLSPQQEPNRPTSNCAIALRHGRPVDIRFSGLPPTPRRPVGEGNTSRRTARGSFRCRRTPLSSVLRNPEQPIRGV